MNAHQLYAANLVASFTPEDVANMVCPEAAPEVEGRLKRRDRVAQEHTIAEVHNAVKLYPTPATMDAWATKLADAAAVPRGNRPITWALALAEYLADIPEVAGLNVVTELRPVG